MIKKKRILGLVLAIVLGLSWNPIPSMATEETPQEGFQIVDIICVPMEGEKEDEDIFTARASVILNGIVYLDFRTEGAYLEYYTNCNQLAEEVGVRDLKIQKKVGIFWSTVASGGSYMYQDKSTYYSNATVVVGEYGCTYRASCVHFAYVGGTEHTIDGCSTEKVCYMNY